MADVNGLFTLPGAPGRRAPGCVLALIAALAVLTGVAAAESSPPPGGAPGPTLVVLGDSLSAGYGIRVEDGWVALLARRLEAEGYGYRVVNASVSGETTGGGLARLPRVLAVHHPAIVLIELGSNDGLRGLPVGEIERNLTDLIARSRAAGAQVLLIGMRMPGNYGPEYTAKFYATFGSVAKAERVALVPFLLERIALDEARFQADRLHPDAVAQPALLETVWPVLQPLLRGAGRASARPTGTTP
ncbi:MAG TPA: arylesterase [Steroidobacteraceae bacterium]|nr:arylesterase [Steroidobacteraceae bacterium]